ncbi:GLPGLI family protein [Chryseobacterium soldanellicola]|uniref:GLPGLI family protein n=1 Tax=Chryseobacterium soldanellicola TaxID=311333 RepID=A0A1H1AJU7_9FLAO|nr:GLPGLI family protein [Chryseobacterium soldanellicola]SDQ39910.1 GLPGLI family protein [Chryseobacterium soldanellicola]
MKKKLFVFALLFLLTMSYGQTTRYIYETSVNPDSINLVSLKTEKTFLDVKANRSLFISENKLIKDSLFSAFKLKEKEDNTKQEKDLSKVGVKKHIEPAFFEYFITKNIPEQKVYYYDKVAGKQIYYQEDRPLKWEISDVTEKQNGYLSQKAVVNFGGRIWTAWFTKEIAISDGPYKFSGLPGLIVKLEDDKGDYKFDLVKKITVQNGFEEQISSDAKQSTRIAFNGDKAALELEFVKNKRLGGNEGGMPDFGGGGRHGGGMRGGNHQGGGGMSHKGMNGNDAPMQGTSENVFFKNTVSENPIELK